MTIKYFSPKHPIKGGNRPSKYYHACFAPVNLISYSILWKLMAKLDWHNTLQDTTVSPEVMWSDCRRCLIFSSLCAHGPPRVMNVPYLDPAYLARECNTPDEVYNRAETWWYIRYTNLYEVQTLHRKYI